MKVIAGVIIGGVIGYAVGYFGKCASGMCPLTSNPYIGLIVGALMGAIFTFRK